MSPRIVLAFACGVTLAAGIVYMAVRPEPVSQARLATTATVKPVSVSAVVSGPPSPQSAAPAPTPTETAPPRTQPAAKQVTAPPAPRREKPSPLRRTPPLERPVIIARVEPPPSQQPLNRPEPAADPKPAPPPHEDVQPAPHEQAKAAAPSPPQASPPPPAPQVTAPPPVATPHPTGPETSAILHPRQPHVVTLLAGTALPVRIGESISTQRNRPGDRFLATLDKPLVIDGFIIAEKGARLEGRIVESDQGPRVEGVAHLSIELITITTSDAQRIRIRTAPFVKNAMESYGEDAAKVAGGAAIGAVIGAIAGGGKGAAIGAGVGGAAGASDVLLTRGRPAKIPVETRVSFRVEQPVTITERLN